MTEPKEHNRFALNPYLLVKNSPRSGEIFFDDYLGVYRVRSQSQQQMAKDEVVFNPARDAFEALLKAAMNLAK